jgi:RNA polymerase sigma-70 factor (ECF subfamily)
LLRPHFDALYASALRLSMLVADAEDLVQEVCIIAYEQLDELEAMRHPRAWLLKVLYHQFVDAQRVGQRSPVGLADTGIDSREPDAIAARDMGLEQQVDTDIRIERILRAMQCLSGDQCALVALHDIEGLTVEEIGEMTGLATGTIKSKLHRTRAKLGRLVGNSALQRPQLRAIGNGK